MVLALLLAQTVVLGDVVVELRTSRDPAVVVTRRGQEVWKGVPRAHQPWKLAGGDIDGNGLSDFAVGLHKETHLYPHAHRTVFFYEVRDDRVVPKWKGSSLGRPLEDFAYATAEGRPVLAALQRRLDDTLGLFVWRWNGFGFHLERERGNWRDASLGGARPDFIEVRTQSGSQWVKL